MWRIAFPLLILFVVVTVFLVKFSLPAVEVVYPIELLKCFSHIFLKFHLCLIIPSLDFSIYKPANPQVLDPNISDYTWVLINL